MLYFVIGKPWGGTAGFSFILIVALPDDFPILIRRMPDLGAVHAAAVPTYDTPGENPDSAML